jgi:hypothetical protein
MRQQQQQQQQVQQQQSAAAPGQLAGSQIQSAASRLGQPLLVPGQQQLRSSSSAGDRIGAASSAAATQAGSSAAVAQTSARRAPQSPLGKQPANNTAGSPGKFIKINSSESAPAPGELVEVFRFVKQYASARIYLLLCEWLASMTSQHREEIVSLLQQLSSDELRSFLKQLGITEQVGDGGKDILVHVSLVASRAHMSKVVKSIHQLLQKNNPREAAEAADSASITLAPREGDCDVQLQQGLTPSDHQLAAQGAGLLSVLLAAPKQPGCCSRLLQLVKDGLRQREQQQQRAAAAAAAAGGGGGGGAAQRASTTASTDTGRRSDARHGIEDLQLLNPKPKPKRN